MSLRETYADLSAREKQVRDPLTAPLQKVAADLAHDLKVLERTAAAADAKGLRRFFSGLLAARLRATRDVDAGTLTYDFCQRREVVKGVSHNDAIRLAGNELRTHFGYSLGGEDYLRAHVKERSIYTHECETRRVAALVHTQVLAEVLKQLRSLDAYRALHALCADPQVDMRIEAVVEYNIGHKRDIHGNGGGYSWNWKSDKTTVPFALRIRIHAGEAYSASTDAKLFAPAATSVAAPKL